MFAHYDKKETKKFSKLRFMDTAAKCRRCNGDLDRKGKPDWCKTCWAAYHREYEGTREDMMAAKAFQEGAAAMKHLLVTAFLKLSLVPIRGGEAARYIAEATPPRYGEQPMPAPGPQSLPNKTAPEVANGSR